MRLSEAVQKIRHFKSAAKAQFAFPGGYEFIFVTSDGACLCSSCVEHADNQCHIKPDMHDGWQITGMMTTADTDDSHACDHCDTRIGCHPCRSCGADDCGDNPVNCDECRCALGIPERKTTI